MDYLSWLSKTPAVNEITDFEEYIKKEKEESIRIMKKRLKRGKTTDKQVAEDILGAANKLYVKGEFNAAIDKIKEALAYNNTFDGAYYLLGIIYEEQGNAEKSFNAFLIAASIKRTDINLWKKLYTYKKREEDIEYQIYILKRIKKIKTSPEILKELLTAYEKQNNIERVFEVRAEMIFLDGFPVEFIVEILSRIRTLKNKVKIVDTISKILDKEKPFLTLSDEFIVGYIDLLFVESRYHLLSQLKNSLEYCRRKVESTRSLIILFFSTIISETQNKCILCAQQAFCTCKDTLDLDISLNILIESAKKSAIINVSEDISIIIDPIHLPLTGYFLDLLMKMRKYKLVLKLLLFIDKNTEDFLVKSEEKNTLEVKDVIVMEAVNIKKRIAAIYDRIKEYDRSIIQYKAILSYKGISESLYSVFEEVKMRISEIYKKTGNIDLALEYALQIQTTEITTGIERDTLVFYKKTNCMHIRSLMYKAMHIYELDKIVKESGVRKYFINSLQEVIMFLVNNTFIFTKKKKKRKDITETESSEQIISTKEFENDYELLHEISGLGKICSKNEVPHANLYDDIIASLLGGLTVLEWHDILYKYATALYYDGLFSVSILLLRKALTSHLLRSSFEEYTGLLWLLIRISRDSQDIESLHWAVTHTIRYYAYRKSREIVSFYYLCYFLINQIPKFHRKSEYYKFQKNVQRNLRRKNLGAGDTGNILCIMCFSYMPSFIYTDTAARLERDVELPVILSPDTSLLGISRAIALASLFLTHASSRKVVDRDRYIEKGIRILRKYTETLKSSHDHLKSPVKVDIRGGTVSYMLKLDEKATKLLYTEEEPSEKLSLLLYNLGRAFHQYKLFGMAEKYYVESLSYTKNRELLTLLQINISLFGKKIEISSE